MLGLFDLIGLSFDIRIGHIYGAQTTRNHLNGKTKRADNVDMRNASPELCAVYDQH